jgi:HlyD family secretion protein
MKGALCVAVLSLAACSGHRVQSEYSGAVETREIQIGSKVGGRVTAVPVEEGQLVKSGASLVCFESDELKAQRDQARAKVDQAIADLARLQHGSRPEEIAQAEAAAQQQLSLLEAARKGPREQELREAQADFASAKADAANAQTNFGRIAMLVRGVTISEQQYDDARARRDAAAQHAESLRQRLTLLQAGTRTEDLKAADDRYQEARAAAQLARQGFRVEDIEAARGRLAEAKGHVAELDVRLKEAALSAPADAVVQAISVRPGDLVPAGRVVMTMLEATQLWVKIYVPETQLGSVSIGQKATVQVNSLPGRPFAGHVEQISSQAEFLPRNVQSEDDRQHQVFAVKVRVNNPEGLLKSGMSARVHWQ